MTDDWKPTVQGAANYLRSLAEMDKPNADGGTQYGTQGRALLMLAAETLAPDSRITLPQPVSNLSYLFPTPEGTK